MTFDEYKEELQKLEQNFVDAKHSLQKEYAISQAIYNIGDIVLETRTNIIIQVQKIRTYVGIDKIPIPAYVGISLTKKLEPKKNGESNTIFGNDNSMLLKSNS